MMFLCLKKWQESHKMMLHYEQIWFMIDCERITSKFCVIFPKISRVFPPRYLNFHPKSKHLQTVKFLKTEFSLSFQKKEHINFISTYYTVITTYSLKESWSNSAISKKDCNFKMPFWKLSGGLFIQIAKRFDSLNDQMPLTNDHFKHRSVTYEWPLNYECPLNYEWSKKTY